MKALTTLRTLTIVAVLSLVVGCSDQITSSGEVRTKKTGSKVEEGIPIITPVYHVHVSLKPGNSFKFLASKSGFINFTSIGINIVADTEDKLSADCKYLSVYGKNKVDLDFSCQGSGFAEKEITIENQSANSVNLDVILQGTKNTSFVPVIE